MDRRDAPTWIVIELTPLGEVKLEEGSLEKSLRSDLGVDRNFPIFIPATTYRKNGKDVTLRLMEGYVFVASGLPETDYFALESKPYVAQVMSTRPGPYKMRVLSTVPDSQVGDLRRQLQGLLASDIAIYDKIRVIEGTYRNLEGVVMGIRGDNAFVRINLRSMEVIATIPLVSLESLEEGGEGSSSP